MDHLQVVNPIGIAGGLAILWKRNLKVSSVRSSNFFIEVIINDEESGKKWHLINVYASCNDNVRRSQWDALVRYRHQTPGEWVMWGDFNDLLWEDEKQGGRRRDEWSLRAFRNFVSELGAIDLGYSGFPFTWTNRRFGDGMVRERLDRVLVSPGWRVWSNRAAVQHLFSVGSDHAALLLDTNPPGRHGHRPFRFDKRWVADPESREVVSKGWQIFTSGSRMYEVFQRVRSCRYELRKWSKAKGLTQGGRSWRLSKN
ncbi:hypothetical protein Vadar_011755 [Vaccinium darrowii]|uniref:Uncharacterized protein n=1 Tax=Vaccinium darrowii TaxID=229202 RepID=A0ACB7YLK2_9ERIC|nr:hypothetical protein Vadar_011755 [Vaccinium darrowii]